MKRFVSLILSVCFLFSINTVSYAANISSRKASNPVIQSMNDQLSYLKEGESILVISNGKVLLSDPYQFDKIYSIQLLQ